MEEILRRYAALYEDLKYFEEDPSFFPRQFHIRLKRGEASLQDVEVSGLIAAHLAWGRRSMIVRDCYRAFDEMQGRPYDYVMSGSYRSGDESLHRTVKWDEFAEICSSLRKLYSDLESLECLSPDEIRVNVFGQKSDLKAANKKIHMFRRWMVRQGSPVDFGLWTSISPKDLVIPLDTHVHAQALEMGITARRSADYATACEITEYFRKIFPDDPCKGDFALFGYAIARTLK